MVLITYNEQNTLRLGFPHLKFLCLCLKWVRRQCWYWHSSFVVLDLFSLFRRSRNASKSMPAFFSPFVPFCLSPHPSPNPPRMMCIQYDVHTILSRAFRLWLGKHLLAGEFVFKYPTSHFMFYHKGHSAWCFPLGPGDVSYMDQSVPSCLLEAFSSSLSDSFASQPVCCFSGFCVHRTEYIQLPTWSLLPAGPTFNAVNISQFDMATFFPTGSFPTPFLLVNDALICPLSFQIANAMA